MKLLFKYLMISFLVKRPEEDKIAIKTLFCHKPQLYDFGEVLHPPGSSFHEDTNDGDGSGGELLPHSDRGMCQTLDL